MDSEQLSQIIINELLTHGFQPQFCFPCTIKDDTPIQSTFMQLTLKDSQSRYICKAIIMNDEAERDTALQQLNKFKSASPSSCVQILHAFVAQNMLIAIMPKGIQNLQTFLKRRERLSDEKLIDLLFQITLSVASVHSAGFSHGDIDPTNLITFEKQKIKLAKLNNVISFTSLLPCEDTQIIPPFEEVKREYAKVRNQIQNDSFSLAKTLITLIASSKKPFIKYESITTSENLQNLLNSTQIFKADKRLRQQLLKEALLNLLSKNSEEKIDSIGLLKILLDVFYSEKQEQNHSRSIFGSLIHQEQKEFQENLKTYSSIQQTILESQTRLNLLSYKALDLQKWYIKAIIKRAFHFKDSDGTLMQYKGAVLIDDLETPNGIGLLTTPDWTYQGLFIKGMKSKGRLVKITKEEYQGRFQNELPHGEGIQRIPGMFLQYKGSMKAGFRNGKGLLKWDEDIWYQGNFANNLIKGEGRFECLQFSILSKSVFNETYVGGPIQVSGTISAKQKLVPKMLKHFGQEYKIELHGPVNFLFQDQNFFSCRYNQGRLISFYNFNLPDRRSFNVLNEEEDQIDPATLTGKMKMEWDYVQHHPSGVSGTHNCYYEGEVLNGKEHGLGLKINKIDKVKYTGRFNMGQREDQNATQIEIEPVTETIIVYRGPFMKDEKHGTGEIIRNEISYVVKYERGQQKNIMTKRESLNSYCEIF